mmetsp:Transcript_56443/g.150987  ORF Transcript_56443/g.150987 Transcript_56443/m.150987 type:complete len:200 (-) Transcript_56443:160-759(-)
MSSSSRNLRITVLNIERQFVWPHLRLARLRRATTLRWNEANARAEGKEDDRENNDHHNLAKIYFTHWRKRITSRFHKNPSVRKGTVPVQYKRTRERRHVEILGHHMFTCIGGVVPDSAVLRKEEPQLKRFISNMLVLMRDLDIPMARELRPLSPLAFSWDDPPCLAFLAQGIGGVELHRVQAAVTVHHIRKNLSPRNKL